MRLNKLIVIAALTLALAGCVETVDQNGVPITPSPTPSPTLTPIAVDPSLKIEDITVGQGAEAKAGDKLKVNYTGKLTNGTVFDSSLTSGRTPFEFTLGAGNVIQGWEQGVQGMKVGGKRKLTVPPALGYGSQAQTNIPANSTLVFEIDLVQIEN